jgi:hypothetical protein
MARTLHFPWVTGMLRMGMLHNYLLLLISLSIFAAGCGIDRPIPPRSRLPQRAETQSFIAARTIFENKCITCHDGQHDRWYGQGEQFFIDEQLVVPGNPNGSKLIQELKNSGGDMPDGEPMIPDAEYQVIRSWITTMQP